MKLDGGFEITIANSDWELERLVNAIGLLGVLLGVEGLPSPTRPKKKRGSLLMPGGDEVDFTPPTHEEKWKFGPSPNRYVAVWKSCFYQEPDENAKTDVNWMKMDIQTPYLRIPKWAKGANCSDVGSVFRAPHRLTVDQRVFRQNRARRQGSILLDTSGSMSLSKQEIEQIVKAVPAAVIGTYGGYTGEKGAVRVLAKGGRLVTEDKEYKPVGGANGVDGPALRWLGAQPLPRIWISDGKVTGVDDRQTEGLLAIAAGICERYRIQLVPNVKAAMRRL